MCEIRPRLSKRFRFSAEEHLLFVLKCIPVSLKKLELVMTDSNVKIYFRCTRRTRPQFV